MAPLLPEHAAGFPGEGDHARRDGMQVVAVALARGHQHVPGEREGERVRVTTNIGHPPNGRLGACIGTLPVAEGPFDMGEDRHRRIHRVMGEAGRDLPQHRLVSSDERIQHVPGGGEVAHQISGATDQPAADEVHPGMTALPRREPVRRPRPPGAVARKSSGRRIGRTERPPGRPGHAAAPQARSPARRSGSPRARRRRRHRTAPGRGETTMPAPGRHRRPGRPGRRSYREFAGRCRNAPRPRVVPSAAPPPIRRGRARATRYVNRPPCS